MKKTIVAIMVVSGLLASANANLISNGDLEADGYTGTGMNNQVTNVTAWAGVTRISTTSDNGEIPGSPNSVFRMQHGDNVRQDFDAGDWGSADTFTVSLNACEVWWKSGSGTGNNLIWVSLRPSGGNTEYVAQSFDLQDTHGGNGVTYADWTAAQTHTFQFSGQDLIDGGATAGQDLRINIYSRDINWVDNVSVIPEPATLGLVAAFGGSVLFIRRRFML